MDELSKFEEIADDAGMTDAELLRFLATEIAELRAITTAQVELLGVIKDAVQPTLDALTGNPMFRMMFGGDK